MELSNSEMIKASAQGIKRLVQMVSLKNSRYPFFPTTFSLWRNQKYVDLLELLKGNHQQLDLEFHIAVDYEVFDQFVAKIRLAAQECIQDLKIPEVLKIKGIAGKEEHRELVKEYSTAFAQQLVQIELFLDLLQIPYGIKMDRQQIELKHQFNSEKKMHKGYIGEVIDKHGQTAVFSGLTKIGTQVWTKLVFGLTTIVGGINIVGVAGGLAITKLIDLISEKFSEKKTIEQVKIDINKFKQNSEILSQRYRLCKKLLKGFLSEKNEAQKNIYANEFQQIIRQVFQVSDGSVVVKELQNGWKIVDIKQQPQQIEFNYIHIHKQQSKEQIEIIECLEQNDG